MGPLDDGEGLWTGLLGEFWGRLGLELWEFWSRLRRGFADGTCIAGRETSVRGEKGRVKKYTPLAEDPLTYGSGDNCKCRSTWDTWATR